MTPFNERIIEALETPELRSNLRGAMDFLRSKRSLSIEDYALWQQHQGICLLYTSDAADE